MVFLRAATQSDMNLLYEWANDPAVRENSFNTDPIPYETHVAWFQRMINDDGILQFILMDGEIPVGQIRLSLLLEEAEIGYSIASEFRGKGYGRRILQLIVEKVQDSYPNIQKLVAKVKPDNIPSKRLFESEGFNMTYSGCSLRIHEGEYYEPSEFNIFGVPDAICLADIYERRTAK